MSSVITDAELKKSVEALSEKFTEAMVQLEDARHSAGTVYFSEDAKEAEEIVQDTLNDFSELLSGLDAKQQLWVKRTIGLKMEELKAQLQMLQDLARE
ncbi:hypothetical protein HPB47_016290 [Ixodes persulcatus]|uniref:Uncharacterized protein n=1 Tax=Ixodes persulcatus TaxID=34615 RepID=A0AC60QR89_IXOPE|nr:hypothetical protein HPB47_016290 [Ixodes persulcatus]